MHGDDVALFVNTTARAVQVQAYRMGYYQGLGGRLVCADRLRAGDAHSRRRPSRRPGHGQLPVAPTMTLNVTKDWPPGCYLLKLVGDGGEEQFVPLTVRDDASMASYVIQNSVTTWQAYNLWGDYSLYYGRTSTGGSDFANRARVVSFDRPYPQTWASGAADFVGNELPLLIHLESLGLDLTYWTDVDLHAQPAAPHEPHAASSAWATTSTGPSPCARVPRTAIAAASTWPSSAPTPATARSAWSRRSVGPNRLQVCYKDAAEDPLALEQPALTTVNWNQAPVNDPESTLIGAMYQSVGAKADMVVTDASSWFYDGCNLERRSRLPQRRSSASTTATCPALPGPAQPRRPGPLARPGPVQLVRHHLLHRSGQRWRRARQRLGELRLACSRPRASSPPSWSPAPSPASPT